MKLTILGGADEVGASCTLIEIAGKKILVDAGIRISPKTSRGLQNDQLPHLAHIADVGGPDVMLITHAHTDHTGALPQVIRSYPHVPIYGTQATIDLSRVLLSDSSRLMESRLEADGELPLYDAEDVERLFERWQPVSFQKAIKLGADLQATFHPSGHIAGAGMIVFESTEGVLVMSGDVSVSNQRTVVSAKPPRIKADALVLESTYGGRPHANRAYEERRLIDTLKQVVEGGGKVLIPAFALGRAQEVIQILLAFRDELDTPVYVDGMVRAVCDAYDGFSEILPKSTTKMAGNRKLFFRQNVRPVRSKQERDEIIRDDKPKIIVASSGMLTGGASVGYAAALAPDERNAIFLTGYQDEESPGRFLQNVLARKARGDTPILHLGKDRVPLRCQIGKYSLSAHADNDELISIAEALDAERVFLVHGDTEARDALWEGLKQKKRFVSRPKVGQEKVIEPRRQLTINRDDIDAPSQVVDVEALWNMLGAHQGEEITARELAQVWYGDVEKWRRVVESLEEDAYYFAQDWRDKQKFTVKKRWQVEKSIRSRHIMRRHPDLAGKLVVARNANNQPRLAVVTGTNEDGFTAVMQGTKANHHSGDALVWVIGEWNANEDENTKLQLNDLLSETETTIESVMPYATRQLLAAKGDPVQPTDYVSPLPQPLPEGEASETLLHQHQVELTAVVLALAIDGAAYTDDGLRVERALPNGPVNQQVARDAALRAFPPEARLRKVGILQHKKTLILTFDFPEVARDKYRDSIEALRLETGWDANVKMTTNQQALSSGVSDVLPPGSAIVKGPSLYMNQREVAAEVEGLTEDEVVEIEAAYMALTNYKLRLVRRGATTPPDALPEITPSANATDAPVPETDGPMEINAAYSVVRSALVEKGLQKAGSKHGEIVLTFISPQVGARHTEEITALAQQTGYAMRIHEYPMQNIIMDEARALLRRAGWNVRKGPGIHTDRGEVSVKLADPVDDEEVTRLSNELETATGYRLVIR